MTPKFGGAHVKNVIIFKDDKIRFKAPSTLPHNVLQMANETFLDQCNFDMSLPLGSVGEIFIGYEITFVTAGTFHYSCSIGGHCAAGQKLTVEVKDTQEGLRCHSHKVPKVGTSHNTQGTESEISVPCPDGEVKARSVDNKSYGSLNANECSEFCISPIALNYMVDVADEGSCVDLNFIYNSITKIIRPPNSPMDIEVVVFSNSDTSSQCHCHSYEEITCPEEESSDDLLYVEHTQEIAEFCTGVLNGSEEDCPYKCFQPMEVLHLHYIDCPSRTIDSGYEKVYSTNKCHIGAPAPEEESAECESTDPLSRAPSSEATNPPSMSRAPSSEATNPPSRAPSSWGIISLISFFSWII